MNNRPRIWDESKLKQALEMAEEIGHSRVELPSEHDAYRFRLRLYDYRKAKNIGQGIVITLDGKEVVLVKSVPNSSDIKVKTGTQE